MSPNTSTTSPGPSLTQFTEQEQTRLPSIPHAIPVILHAIALASKLIHKIVNKGALEGMADLPGTLNASGDEQQGLDLIAHDHLMSNLAATGEVCAIISEEEKGMATLAGRAGKYIIALDPLDGSANLQVNAPVGTIFSIYQRLSPPGRVVHPTEVLQSGSRQIAAGYILYSTATTFVYGTRHGVHGFTYDPTLNEFFLTHSCMHLPQVGKSYAINDGYLNSFPNYVQHYIQLCRDQGLSARYTGALVADFHRHLIEGGIYLYPATQKAPAGKLRLMFESNPLAFIAEQAGGLASDGKQPILQIEPSMIHQRTPLYIGSASMIKKLLAFAHQN